MKCPLCEELNSLKNVIHIGKHAFVLVNLRAVKKGHVMVLPKRHVLKYDDLREDEAKEFFDLVEATAKAIQKEYTHYPIIVINPINRRSEQHIHAHLIPSDKGAREFFSIAENLPLNEVAPQSERREVRELLSKYFD